MTQANFLRPSSSLCSSPAPHLPTTAINHIVQYYHSSGITGQYSVLLRGVIRNMADNGAGVHITEKNYVD